MIFQIGMTKWTRIVRVFSKLSACGEDNYPFINTGDGDEYLYVIFCEDECWYG